MANRITEIELGSQACEWRHVWSADNPADALSRGQLPENFIVNNLWQSGPSWLMKPQHEWPENPIPEPNSLTT